MRTRFLVAAVTALALAAPAGAALPQRGLVVPGRSLGGVRLGDRPDQVIGRWGRGFSLCRGCARRTWYFNYVPFSPQGLGVEYRHGVAAALFTLWSPTGWHTGNGLSLGDPAARVTSLYGPLARTECGTYYILSLPSGRTKTTFAVVGEKLWSFAVSLGAVPACR